MCLIGGTDINIPTVKDLHCGLKLDSCRLPDQQGDGSPQASCPRTETSGLEKIRV